MRVKTNELEGVSLDWAAGKVQNLQINIGRPIWVNEVPKPQLWVMDRIPWHPSTKPDQGFPILVRNKVSLLYNSDPMSGGDWYEAVVGFGSDNVNTATYTRIQSHREPLVAGLRAVVYYHLGSEVDIPDELMGVTNE